MTYSYYQGVTYTSFRRTKYFIGAITAAILLAVGMFASVLAQPTGSYTAFGNTSAESDGLHVISDMTDIDEPYGGVSFGLESGTTVNDLTNLSATFTKAQGDCGGGAPRFSVRVSPSQSIFVNVGDAPNFATCADGSTGNLIDDSDIRVDTSQVGGTFYDTWTHAKELVGASAITSLSFVVDGGWTSTGTQEFVLTSASVNAVSYSFVKPVAATSKDQCKNGGWMNFQTPYKNQGQCVSSVVSNRP